MNLMAAKLLSRHGSKLFRTSKYKTLRLSSSCCSKDSSKDPPSKPESCLPEKEKESTEPPPCAATLPCPPRSLASNIPDPNNPCNYCPPECIDPDAPNLVRLKRKQCKFQEPNDIPVYLKGGKFDIFLYQLTVILTFVSVGTAGYYLYLMASK